ncbi:uncharacterized protein PGTG_20981 [Puccinia graminis f. sp. tritici CRL 75-36-700-3]|uniref:GH16 domain-containing protein n=1 Tax=Puccinia graminis f. sp. tritici (strain CRL 75-36-700-3 / race SCCL) TaxID=418459 RepID=H6QPZ6_PUCGT|nr:uncharacterized protein PGTG_20981 [Puccinia graminis f. sp. tritici CRL 75-36-700-3]EHS64519.1 hypothetical protein PGTG_20981 [Puccinia graminis f. sp. tritici CRL 75-36-700-3]
MSRTKVLSTAFLIGCFLLLDLSYTSAECAPSSSPHHHRPHRGGKHSKLRDQVDNGDYGSKPSYIRKQDDDGDYGSKPSYLRAQDDNGDYGSGSYNPNSNLLGLDLPIQLGYGREPNSQGKKYNLTLSSSGNKFFDDWDFFSDSDPTHGQVAYQPVNEAWKQGLVSVGPSSHDKNLITAKMKVDNTNWLAQGEARKSVRLSSKKSFKYGLLVLDALKMPFGCSTWPAFWTVGNNWPHDGEIDIVEGVNMLNTNQMTLHTGPGCTIQNPMLQAAVGNVLNPDCDVYASSNLGCGVHDHSNASYGQPFNQAGGGVFAMEWSPNGVSIWRFSRGEVPRDLQSGHAPQPSTWPIRPVAHWSSDICNNMNDEFSEHRIIFDITLCGDWAGSAGVFNANNACSGSCTDLVKDPTNYKDANWEIASVKLYQ